MKFLVESIFAKHLKKQLQLRKRSQIQSHFRMRRSSAKLALNFNKFIKNNINMYKINYKFLCYNKSIFMHHIGALCTHDIRLAIIFQPPRKKIELPAYQPSPSLLGSNLMGWLGNYTVKSIYLDSSSQLTWVFVFQIYFRI